MSKTSIPALKASSGCGGSAPLAITAEVPQSMDAFLRDCVPKAEVFQSNLALARGNRANCIGVVV
ncbi:MAG: hypothetical protein EOR68_01910 [Mesorhizobium sp.]|uniref:hypothetical protein n=1 Tax=Mesorhizobium sp. TaxID=1871066 RepID=UPI000FEA2DE0|nr:hypothetical protein [Mesorhizobium sp.]RWM04868.1 MAG: hypothetical protein EOR68_01910 [Mesorhizobium sp.]TIP50687.1 MAG: hypothetical protein E5X77_05410 [Mesorhizobium sp.]TJV72763.1 MAG: hypothetical protein E5X76_09195 [Mesorhizobium sp.]